LAEEDLRQKALPLHLAAERDQRRAEQVLADVPDPPRCARARVLLVEDHLAREACAASARGHGPAEPDPPGRTEPPLPREAQVDARGLVARAAPAARVGVVARELGGEPVGDLAAERLVGGIEAP